MEIIGLNESIAYCEAKGLAECFNAYAGNCTRESILEIGFNENSGYTYIALENGVTICSMMGGNVEFLVTDFETGEEMFFNRFQYEEAVNYQSK
jgi:hypothetical protein